MTVHNGGNLLTALAIGFGVIIAAGFECPVAKDPITFIGDNAKSVRFMWECSLSPNESVHSVTWIKDNTTIATAVGSDFTATGSYVGRVERNGTYGISLHNITQKDYGHYNISVILNHSLEGNIAMVTACQSAYLPALPAGVWKYNDSKHQLHLGDGASSLCDQEGVSKLDIGLICGLVLLTIIGLFFVSCFFYRKRRRNMRRKDLRREVIQKEDMQNEDMQNEDMQNEDMQNEDTSTSPEELQTFKSEGRDVALED